MKHKGTKPPPGWTKHGALRMAHQRVINILSEGRIMIAGHKVDDMKTMDDENNLYAILFEKEVKKWHDQVEAQKAAYEKKKESAKVVRGYVKYVKKAKAKPEPEKETSAVA